MSIGLVAALAGLTLAALAMLLAPLFWRRRGAAPRDAYNLAVYRDQLAEVERDLARGVLAAEAGRGRPRRDRPPHPRAEAGRG